MHLWASSFTITSLTQGYVTLLQIKLIVSEWRIYALMIKPLSEPMLECFELDLKERISVDFQSKLIYFHSRKSISKCRLAAILSRPQCVKVEGWTFASLNSVTIDSGNGFSPIRRQVFSRTKLVINRHSINTNEAELISSWKCVPQIHELLLVDYVYYDWQNVLQIRATAKSTVLIY